jgi:hypothetical protein
MHRPALPVAVLVRLHLAKARVLAQDLAFPLPTGNRRQSFVPQSLRKAIEHKRLLSAAPLHVISLRCIILTLPVEFLPGVGSAISIRPSGGLFSRLFSKPPDLKTLGKGNLARKSSP